MIRHRKPHHEVKTGHERWLVSYADFITLLFGFFVVMYSVSQVSDQKYRVLSETLAEVFEGKIPIDAQIKEVLDQYPRDEFGHISGLSPQAEEVDTEVLASEIAQSLVQLVKSGQVSVLALDDAVEINMNANALFASGSADPSDHAKLTFKKLAEHLAPLDYDVEVSGHTDNVPIRTAQFVNNWALSSARALAIVSLLDSGGVIPGRLKASAFGEFQPIADNDTEVGRAKNRRVVLTVTKPQPRLDTPDKVPDNIIDVEPEPDQAPEAPVPSDDRVAPVRLDNGGLLFTSDPDLPRGQK